jgi:hypothetical protein
MPETVRLTGQELTAVTEVRLSTGSCEPTAGDMVPILVQTDDQIDVDVSGLASGSYRIITVSAGSSCCTRGTVAVP